MHRTLLVPLLVGLIVVSAPPPARAGVGSEAPPAMVPVVWLEPSPGPPVAKGALPLYRSIPADDARVRDGERLLDNEPARFMRHLIAWAWQTFGAPPDWPNQQLPIVLQPGGNYARSGFRLLVHGVPEDHRDVPYIILELDASSLSDTFLHEGGHVLHSIAARGHRPSAEWSAVLHTTFAVTDPLTAMAEGYAIHFETLLGHYGRDPEKRNFYHRVAPAFDLQHSKRAEFYAPVADLLTFSQSWARYQAVRDTWPAFSGHVYPDDYLRSQFDPARDRAALKPPNAMIASEGVVASVLFWTSAGLAEKAGARFGEGLEQPAIAAAEQTILRAIGRLPARRGFRPDLVDLVAEIGEPGSTARELAVSRFVAVTRGVTARPEVRTKWRALYRDAVSLDVEGVKPLFTDLDAVRDAITAEALADPGVLRKGIGPVLPVSAPKVPLQLKAFGEAFTLAFDLNAATDAEWLAAGATEATCTRILGERDRAPFASIGDFEKRTSTTLAALGLEPVEMTAGS
jgi:hypothetical protein